MAIDTSKPSVSRIYDYVLGGHHNFEADRAAAERILKFFPSYPTWARINRWFLQMVAARWAEAGYKNVLDLGSGMPTEGHFHTAMPDARVLYTDNDAMTVAYAKDVLGDNPKVSFREADVSQPETIVQLAGQFFGADRHVAIGCIGIAYFIDEASLTRLMKALHRWAAPGSVMALSYIHADAESPRSISMRENYKRHSGAEVFMRSPEQVAQICLPWRVRENATLEEMLGLEGSLGDAEREGVDAEMFGILLEHVG